MLPSNLLRMAAAFATGTEAQRVSTSTGTPKASATSSTSISTHTVEVGVGATFSYKPQEVKKAAVGDIIEFQFYPGGHTVVRAEFGYPCIPYNYTGANKIGFFSGLKSPQAISDNLPTFQVRVNDTKPIFYYCSAPTSCFEHHMIGVINPSANETLEKQLDIAMNATYQLAPGDPFPSEAPKPEPSPTATAISSPSGQPISGVNNGGDHHLSAGAIAGIVIGAAAVLVLAGALIYLCGWKLGKGATRPQSTQTFPPPPMVDAKFSPSPNGPSPALGSTAHYSVPPGNDPYRAYSPSSAFLQSPASMSRSSHPAYGNHPEHGNPNIYSPLTGVEAAHVLGVYRDEQRPPPPERPAELQISPVELPASSSPGNSPLPAYHERKYSWSQGSEAHYRPGDKS